MGSLVPDVPGLATPAPKDAVRVLRNTRRRPSRRRPEASDDDDDDAFDEEEDAFPPSCDDDPDRRRPPEHAEQTEAALVCGWVAEPIVTARMTK